MKSVNRLAMDLVDEARWTGELSGEEADYILDYIQTA
jgi:hypothetical protein